MKFLFVLNFIWFDLVFMLVSYMGVDVLFGGVIVYVGVMSEVRI